MKANVVRLQDNHLIREALTTPLLNVEFILDVDDDEHSVCAMIENGVLYVSSPSGRLKITPRSSNAISIEVTE